MELKLYFHIITHICRMSLSDPKMACKKLGQYEVQSRFYKSKFTFPIYSGLASAIQNGIFLFMTDYHPHQRTFDIYLSFKASKAEK